MNFRLRYAFFFPGVNSRAELVPSPWANFWNGASRRLLGDDKDTNKPDTPLSRHNLIMANNQTLHILKHTNPDLLLFLEALYIKYRNPMLNNGLRASKELVVFS